MTHTAVNVVQFDASASEIRRLQTEETNPEGHEVFGLIALQRNACCRLQTQGQEFLAVLDLRVGGVTDHHTWCFESTGSNAGNATAFQQVANC